MLLKEQNRLLASSLSKQPSITLEEAKSQVGWLKENGASRNKKKRDETEKIENEELIK